MKKQLLQISDINSLIDEKQYLIVTSSYVSFMTGKEVKKMWFQEFQSDSEVEELIKNTRIFEIIEETN